MTQDLLDQAKAILTKGRDMTIATIRDDGFPQATTVTYVSDGLTIYFGCEAESQKARNIARNAKVSLTVTLDYGHSESIRGLSMAAIAERIGDAEDVRRMDGLMPARFPQAGDPAAENNGEPLALIRVTPTVISVLNFAEGLGHTDMIEL